MGCCPTCYITSQFCSNSYDSSRPANLSAPSRLSKPTSPWHLARSVEIIAGFDALHCPDASSVKALAFLPFCRSAASRVAVSVADSCFRSACNMPHSQLALVSVGIEAKFSFINSHLNSSVGCKLSLYPVQTASKHIRLCCSVNCIANPRSILRKARTIPLKVPRPCSSPLGCPHIKHHECSARRTCCEERSKAASASPTNSLLLIRGESQQPLNAFI